MPRRLGDYTANYRHPDLFRQTPKRINGQDPRRLCRWQPDETRINAFAHEVGQLARMAPQLMGTRREDVYLWQALTAVHPRWQRGAQGIGDCFHPDTAIMAPGGGKRIADVRVGDQVYAGDGSITTVVSTQCKTSTKDMVTLKAWGGAPLRVTADHRVLVYRLGKQGKKNINRQLYERENKGNRSRGPNAVVAAYEARTAEWVAAGDVQPGDNLLFPRNFETTEGDNPFGTGPDAAWLLGVWLGDGYAGGGSVEWTLSNEAVSSRLTEVLELHGYAPRRDEDPTANAWRVRVHCVELVRALQAYYDEARTKVFPTWAIGDADLVQGLLDTDGFTDQSGTVTFDSTSSSLAYGVFATWSTAGLAPSVCFVDRSGAYPNAKPLRRVTHRPDRTRARVWHDEQYLCRPILRVDREAGTHVVHDIGVAHHSHSLIAEGAIAHNCVSWGTELVLTMLMALMHVKGQGRFYAEAATEAIYGGCRVEALGKSRGGRSDGAFGAAAAKWSRDWGCICRVDMGELTGNPEHDLRKYSARKAKDWGDWGCGGSADNGDLDGAAREMPVQTVAQVTTVEEAVASISNGYPFAIASGAGFGNMRRDSRGVCRIVDRWMHQMMVGGLRWRGGEPEFRVFQSWGDSCSGPDPGIENPAVSACSWWAVAEDIAWILKTGDCWSYADLQGMPAQTIDITLPAARWYQPAVPQTYTIAT